jgi:hypothetical protein
MIIVYLCIFILFAGVAYAIFKDKPLTASIEARLKNLESKLPWASKAATAPSAAPLSAPAPEPAHAAATASTYTAPEPAPVVHVAPSSKGTI